MRVLEAVGMGKWWMKDRERMRREGVTDEVVGTWRKKKCKREGGK